MSLAHPLPVPGPGQGPSAGPSHRGFHLPESPILLQGLVQIAAAFTGALAVLVLEDGAGIWCQESRALPSHQLGEVIQALSQGADEEGTRHLLEEQGLVTLASQAIPEEGPRAVGALWVLSPTPLLLAETSREGLRRLGDQVLHILAADRKAREAQARSADSPGFIPGLIHALGSLSFAISATLDAFDARFPAVVEGNKHRDNLRKSLDQMIGFVMELRAYVDPRVPLLSRLELESLLREIVRQTSPQALASGVELLLEADADLPGIQADEAWLRTAFVRLLDILLQGEKPGGRLVLRLARWPQEGEPGIMGTLEVSSARYARMDPSRLFEPFYFKGSGTARLVLPGVRRAFESHGGTLCAGPGTGDTVRIRFTLPPVPPAPGRAAGQP